MIKEILIFIFLALLFLFLLDIFFLTLYKFKKKKKYVFKKKISLEKITVESHPYLPFVYKKNAIAQSGILEYPIHNNIVTPELKLNSLRFANGSNGSREILIPKPNNIIRINCLGASTTGNYIRENDKNFSYPIELEKKLKNYNSNIEVNNCGQGGYNSADILVRFLIQVLDTKPDLIILYHAYNDIKSYLTDDFSNDYSHSRKNLAENYIKFQLNSLLPNPPFNFINFLRNKILPSDIRWSLLDMVTKGTLNNKNNYLKGLKVYERNISLIIEICKARNIKILLPSFCFYLYDEIKDSSLHILYKKIVNEENNILKRLAEKYEVDFMDMDKIMPKKKEFFVDSIHFSVKGMGFFSDELSKKIRQII